MAEAIAAAVGAEVDPQPAGRYLAPCLPSQTGDAANVMPQDDQAIPIETSLHGGAPRGLTTPGELEELKRPSG